MKPGRLVTVVIAIVAVACIALAVMHFVGVSGHHHGSVGHGDQQGVKVKPLVIGNLEISQYALRATPPNAPVSAGYMVVKNKGSQSDRLIGGAVTFAGKTEIHEMAMEGEIMKMRPLADGIEIPAGGEVTLKPGGLHMMFMQLSERLEEGQTRKVTLQFEKAGPVEIEMPVKPIKPGGHGH